MFKNLIVSILSNKLNNYKIYIIGAIVILMGVPEMIEGLSGIAGSMWPDTGLPQLDIDAALALMQQGWKEMLLGAGIMAGRHTIEKGIAVFKNEKVGKIV